MTTTVPNNNLINVQTYQPHMLAWLLNSFVGISLTNKEFKDFNNRTANLGDTVTFDLTPRNIALNGLVITEQPSVQRLMPLVCSQASNVSAGYTDQQFIFNAEVYMQKFGKARMMELGTVIEADILRNFVSGVKINDPQNANFGQQQTQSGPFRFFGDGVTPINSYGQLAQAIANFNDFGAAQDDLYGVIPMVAYPAIVQSGLNQFALNRNNETAMSWEIGDFAGCKWHQSNLLPVHIAGTIGNAAAPNNVMTVVSTNDPSGQNITTITFTEPTSSTAVGAIKAGDLMQFIDGVSGQPNLRFLTFIGHQPCSQPVQFKALADASTVSGTVTIQIGTAEGIGLVSAQNQNQNLNTAIQAGMKVQVLPSHRAGAIWSGNQFFMAMPKLPDQVPFPTASFTDPDSGASIRSYYGVQFGKNVRSYVDDCIWGSSMVPENALRLIFPL